MFEKKTALGGATIAIAALISVGGALASPDAKGLNVTSPQNTNTTVGSTTYNFSADPTYRLGRDNEGDGSGGSSGGAGGGSEGTGGGSDGGTPQ